MFRPLILAAAAVAAFLAIPAAPVQAQEYVCRDARTGRIHSTPPSRSEAQHLQNREWGVDCFRYGVPVDSSRSREGGFQAWRDRQDGRGHGRGYDRRDGWQHDNRHNDRRRSEYHGRQNYYDGLGGPRWDGRDERYNPRDDWRYAPRDDWRWR